MRLVTRDSARAGLPGSLGGALRRLAALGGRYRGFRLRNRSARPRPADPDDAAFPCASVILVFPVRVGFAGNREGDLFPVIEWRCLHIPSPVVR